MVKNNNTVTRKDDYTYPMKCPVAVTGQTFLTSARTMATKIKALMQTKG